MKDSRKRVAARAVAATTAITVTGPQFLRSPNATTPAAPPADRAAWDALRELDYTALRELGLRAFNDPDDAEERERFQCKVLMLLPGEWYRSIPAGYKLVQINGSQFEFSTPDRALDVLHPEYAECADIRAGALAFGLLVKP